MLYEHIIELGITVFSIAHRLELKRFHHVLLEFAGDNTGAWAKQVRAPRGLAPARRVVVGRAPGACYLCRLLSIPYILM